MYEKINTLCQIPSDGKSHFPKSCARLDDNIESEQFIFIQSMQQQPDLGSLSTLTSIFSRRVFSG